MNILSRIWPWSKIAKLRKALDGETRSVKLVLAYLDQLHPECRHSIMRGRFYIFHVDHVQEFVYNENPRTSYKVEGLS